MNKKALYLEHYAVGQRRSPFQIHFPESKEKLLTMKGTDAGEGWEKRGMELCGTGWLLCYREYTVSKPTVFATKVSEPVIAVRVQVTNESFSGFEDDPANLWMEDDCCLYWMGDRVLETRLLPGEHCHIELYTRPENLGRLAENDNIMKLLEQSQSNNGQEGMPTPFKATSALEDFLMHKMMHEVIAEKLEMDRFHYLCECFLLMCCGESVALTPPDTEIWHKATEVEAVTQRHEPRTIDLFDEEDKELVEKMALLTRDQLVRKFRRLRPKVAALRNLWDEARTMAGTLDRLFAEEKKVQEDVFADAFMEQALFFAASYDLEDMTESQRTLVKRALVRCCEYAFVYRIPSTEEAEFYVKWAGRPFISQSLKPETFFGMLADLMPEVELDLSDVDGSLQGNRLMHEQINEAFGFRPMSHFTGENAADKPQELVDLYQKLIAHLSDTLDLDSSEGVERSNVVRILDNAYEYNDYMMMLQIELDHFGDKRGYVGRQDDERLTHLVAALEFAKDELLALLYSLKRTSAVYSLYLMMDRDIGRVKDSMAEDTKMAAELSRILLPAIKKRYGKIPVRKVVDLANRLLKVDSMP